MPQYMMTLLLLNNPMLAVWNWQQTANLAGGILAIIGLIGFVSGIFFVKKQEKMADFLKNEIEARKEQVGRIEAERNEYRDNLHKVRGELQSALLRIQDLESKTDLSAVTSSLTKIVDAIDKTNLKLDQQVKEQHQLSREHTKVCHDMTMALHKLLECAGLTPTEET